jgi:predicted Zn-ribbon and HTH transcriptional regulator
MSIEARICRCERCRFEWVKRIEGRPAQCPNCKQPNWDKPVGVLKIGRPKKKAPGKKKGK